MSEKKNKTIFDQIPSVRAVLLCRMISVRMTAFLLYLSQKPIKIGKDSEIILGFENHYVVKIIAFQEALTLWLSF